MYDFIQSNWLKVPVALYVAGFVVHNVYLSQFGVYEFELVEARYVLSGIGFLGFTALILAYSSIKIDLSCLENSCRIDKLLPWAARVLALPYVVFGILYGPEEFDLLDLTNGAAPIVIACSRVAHMIVGFAIFDLVLMPAEGDSLLARLTRSIYRIVPIPLLVVTIAIAVFNEQFRGVAFACTYPFFLFMGVAFYQVDKKHGIEPNYLDNNANAEHETYFVIIVGIISISVLMGILVTNYSQHIYPKIPSAIGGSRIEVAVILVNGTTQRVGIVQETKEWLIVRDPKTRKVSKIKIATVDRIDFESG
jgi:hypothetical protein